MSLTTFRVPIHPTNGNLRLQGFLAVDAHVYRIAVLAARPDSLQADHPGPIRQLSLRGSRSRGAQFDTERLQPGLPGWTVLLILPYKVVTFICDFGGVAKVRLVVVSFRAGETV